MLVTSERLATGGIAEKIAEHLAWLGANAPGRPPGSPANRAATDEVARGLQVAGLDVVALPFHARWWQPGLARLAIGGREVDLPPPPFCRPVDAHGKAVVLEAPAELRTARPSPGSILVLRNGLSREPYFPRAFPFLSIPAQLEVLAGLESFQPAAVIAEVADERAFEPVFEDPDLAFAYATVPASAVAGVATGDEIRLAVAATISDGAGVNLSAGATGGIRTVVCAHVDSKVTTPGYLDNGGGVAALLALAETGLDELDPVELVYFNGEDHYAAPGEQAWLAARDLREVRLVVNVDGAGLRGHRAAVSTVGATPELEARVAELIAAFRGLERGAPWYESDHAAFAMQGIPAVAITSAGPLDELKRLAHDPADAFDRLDPEVLADVVRFVRILLARSPGP